MRKVLMLSVMALAVPMQALADGVPTLDIVNERLQQTGNALQKSQLGQLKDTFDQVAMQLKQQIDNAKRLGKLDQLVDGLKEYSSLLDTQAAKTVLSDIYGIPGDAQNFKDQALQKLSEIYDLPSSNDEITGILSKAGASPLIVSDVVQQNAGLLKEQEAIVQDMANLSNSSAQRVEATKLIDRNTERLAALGDNSVGATMQLNTSVAIQQSQQFERVIDELRALRETDTRKRIEALEERKAQLEAQIRYQDDLRKIRESPHRPVPLSSWGN